MIIEKFRTAIVDAEAATRAHAHWYSRSHAAPNGNTQTTRAQVGTEEPGYLERIVVKSADRITLLDVNEIDWIEAAGVYVHLHVGAKTHPHRASVTQLLERLDSRLFVRIHRSAAVNPARIRELQPRTRGDYTVILADGTELMLSRGYRYGLERWLRQKL
ncbi:MAG: hypothetical protein GEV06_13665 [Luteitalea sp.]|nr:hypothetical protein [Luteitalea sp.]